MKTSSAASPPLFRTVAMLLLALLVASAGYAADDSLAGLIQSGERDAALELIRAGGDVDDAQGDGTTPLHWAVYRIDTELVRALLERGAEPNVMNLYGSSPLAEAVKLGHPDLVRMLLEAGADAESPNQDGQTALMLAARTGAVEVAELLVRHGADVNARETWRGQTALMWAADSSHAGMTQFLLEHGADVNLRAFANEWATQITSEPRGQYRPTGGLTPLHYAARSGCLKCVSAIVAAGADVNRPNPDGITPLIVAIENYAFDSAKHLLEHGASPHTWDWWGRTPLYSAVDINSFNPRRRNLPEPDEGDTTAMDIVRLLLEAGVNPNPQLNMHRPHRGGNISRFVDDLLTTGATPLLRAAIGHDTDAIRALLEHGALVDLPNVMGVTPLMAAAGMGISPRDRRVNLGGDVESRAIAAIGMLLEAGADVNARVTDIESRTARIARPSTMTEREGQTALYGAVKFGWARVVQHLLDNGADADIADALGNSPVDAALGRTGGRDNTVSEEVAALLEAAIGSGE